MDDMMNLQRAARVIAPMCAGNDNDAFQAAQVHFLIEALQKSDLGAQADKPPPTAPDGWLLGEPLSRQWFRSIRTEPPECYQATRENQEPGRSRYELNRTRDWGDWMPAYFEWAKAHLRLSRAAIIKHLGEPPGGIVPPVDDVMRGTFWTAPQALAWLCTGDAAEVNRIRLGHHWDAPIERTADNTPQVADMLQNGRTRRNRIGRLAIITALKHCRCRSNTTAAAEPWETCRCIEAAASAMPAFGNLAGFIPLKVQPSAAIFELEWTEPNWAFRMKLGDAMALREALAKSAAPDTQSQIRDWLVNNRDRYGNNSKTAWQLFIRDRGRGAAKRELTFLPLFRTVTGERKQGKKGVFTE